MWVQIWGKGGINGKMIQMGLKLGEKLGDVLEAYIFDIPDKTTIVKVRVNLSTNIPIMHGMYMK